MREQTCLETNVQSTLTQYRLISILFVVGVFVIAGSWKTHIASRFTSDSLSLKLKQHLLVPATFNDRHLSPLPYRIGTYISGSVYAWIIADCLLLVQVIYPSAASLYSSPHTLCSTSYSPPSRSIMSHQMLGTLTGVTKSLLTSRIAPVFSASQTLLWQFFSRAVTTCSYTSLVGVRVQC